MEHSPFAEGLTSLVRYDPRPTVLYEDYEPRTLTRAFYGFSLLASLAVLTSSLGQILEHSHCTVNTNHAGTLGFAVVSGLALVLALTASVLSVLGLLGLVRWHRKILREPDPDTLPWLHDADYQSESDVDEAEQFDRYAPLPLRAWI